MSARSKFYKLGKAAGYSAATWAFDGNTTAETYTRILTGIEEGDPEVMDMQPSPLSGEWAGESIPELFGYRPSDRCLSLYEQGYSDAFWREVERVARYMTEGQS